MNTPCTISEQAALDLEDIVRYIAEDNVSAAVNLRAKVLDALELIARTPAMGRRKIGRRGKIYRLWTVHQRYVVVYTETEPPLILRVVNDNQHLATLLKEPSLS